MASPAQPGYGSTWRKPTSQITDRAARYRANAPEVRPRGEKRCILCGAPKKKIDVMHLDGHEKNTAPENLAYGCRSCNVKAGQTLQAAGLGTKTRQYNPSAGAKSLGQWVAAVMSVKGESDQMTPAAAVDVIRATPFTRRSEFAREIWKRRRRHNPGELLIFGNPGEFTSAERSELTQLWHTARIPLGGAASRHDRLKWAAGEWEKTHPGERMKAYKALEHATRGYGNPGELLIFGNPPNYQKVAEGLSLHAAKKMVGQIHRAGKLAIYRKAGGTYEVHQADKASNPPRPTADTPHCAMCGAWKKSAGLKIGQDPDGKHKLLCKACREGSAEILADKRNPSTQAAKRSTRERAGRIRAARLNASAFDEIRPGSRVTIVNRFGQQRSGRAVMRGPHGWVLNMGGPHGTPAIATPENVTRVRAGNPPVKMQIFFDNAIKKFTAVIYDPKFGNLYGTGHTKKQAAKALHEVVRYARKTGNWRNPQHPEQADDWEKRVRAYEAEGLTRSDAQAVVDAEDQREQEKKRGGVKRRRTDRAIRRNPSDTEEAVRLFESFHGKNAKEIVEKHVSAAVRLDYAALGDLIALGIGEAKHHGNSLVSHWQNENHLGFEGDGVKLASAPGGKQLYLIGGNQNLSKCLEKFDVDADKDFVDLGEIGFVVYLARKVHGNFQPIEYVHEFGEKSGALPAAFYDKLRKQIFLTGGEYFIKSEGVSPGIEN